MESHPGWEVLSDSEDSGDDSQDDDGNSTGQLMIFLEIILFLCYYSVFSDIR